MKKRILALLLSMTLVLTTGTLTFAEDSAETINTEQSSENTDSQTATEGQNTTTVENTTNPENGTSSSTDSTDPENGTSSSTDSIDPENATSSSTNTEQQVQAVDTENTTGPQVGDTVWIKSGSKIYKSTEGKEEYTVWFSHEIKIKNIICDENGKPEWYEFEFQDWTGGWFLQDYSYIKVADTSTSMEKEPSMKWEVEDKTYTASENVVIQKTNEEKQAQTLTHFNLEENRKAHFIDIQGTNGTETTISVSGMLDTNEHKNALVLHFLDNADAIKEAISSGGVAWSYFTVEDSTQFEKEVAAAKEATGEDNRVYYVTLNSDISEDGTISFQTDSFSTFAYIVTFEYEGYTYELSGGGTMYLSDLMKGLELSQSISDVTNVSFSNSELITAEKYQDDWILSSEESFYTEEYMTLTFVDGSSLEIKLTDPTVMYCVSHTERLNESGTEEHDINRREATNNPYKSKAVVNKTKITVDDIKNAADDKTETKDLVIYAAPGMAIRFASGIGFPDGSWKIADSNNEKYKHGNWEWVWSGSTNYILLNSGIKESTYVDFSVTADSKTCQVRIWIIPDPSNNNVTKVKDTVKNSDEYEIRTIPVTLYDYDGYKWNEYWNGRNSGNWFAFYNRVQGTYAQGSLTIPWTGGHLPNSGNLSQGIFQDKLGENNLPVFTSTAQTDLFSKSSNKEMGKTVYNDVGFEFIYEKENGYYTYSSNLNHAQYNKSSNTIELYDQTLSSQIGAEISGQANTVAGFYPFQDINEAIPNWGYNGDGWQGHLSDDYSTRNYGQYAWDLVHSTDSNATINLHFALQIEADFYMPTDKKSQVNGDDLVYEFTGDDDLWVFIDDQLVLDLGGAHSPISGKVDFTNETVYVQNYYPVTVSGNTYTENTSATGRGSAKTFTFAELGINVAADQMHTLRVFYMERWSGESNCRMHFNLPLAPENSVLVSKELTNQDGDNLSVTPDVDYTFQVFAALSDDKKDDELNEEDSAFKALANTQYYILGQENKKLQTDNDGTFKLKSGQTAVFEGVPRFTEVYAVELKPSDGYIYTGAAVSVNKETATDYTWDNSTERKIMKLSSNITFEFTNRMQTQPLTFKKEVVNGTDGLINKEQKFTFDLEFTKEILETGENAIKANDGKTLTNGKPFELGHNESITIPRVPVNMTFDFGEQNPDSTNNSFDNPKYEFTNVTCSVTPDNFNKYSWTVGLNGVNKIIVTNQQRFDLIIKKTGILATDNNKEESQSTIYNVVGMAGNEEIYKGQVAIVGNDSITIKDLPVGTYTVTEDVNWSWRYELIEITVKNNANAKVDRSNKKATFKPISTKEHVTFTNARDNNYWLSGDTHCRNWWGKDGKVEKTSSASKNN